MQSRFSASTHTYKMYPKRRCTHTLEWWAYVHTCFHGSIVTARCSISLLVGCTRTSLSPCGPLIRGGAVGRSLPTLCAWLRCFIHLIFSPRLVLCRRRVTGICTTTRCTHTVLSRLHLGVETSDLLYTPIDRIQSGMFLLAVYGSAVFRKRFCKSCTHWIQ